MIAGVMRLPDEANAPPPFDAFIMFLDLGDEDRAGRAGQRLSL